MSQLFDARGNEFQGALDGINALTLTDARTFTSTLNSLNANVVVDIVGKATLQVHLNVTVAFNAATSITIQGTMDGANFFTVPFLVVQTGGAALTAETLTNIATGLQAGQYLLCASCTGFRQMRVIMSAFTTAGTAVVALRATMADYRIYAQPMPSMLNVSQAPAANTGGTITLPAAGAGLFHYITNFQCTVAMNPATAQVGAAPVFVTTTNIPGTPAWAVPICGNGAASVGGLANAGLVITDTSWSNPLKCTVANTNTTFVLPAPGAACTIRGNVQYYVGA